MRAFEYWSRRLWLLSCLLLAAAGMWGSACAEGEPVVVPKLPPEALEARFYIEKSDWGLPPEGRLIPEDVMVGAPVWLVYEVTNRGDVVVEGLIEPENERQIWRIQVNDASGRPVAYKAMFGGWDSFVTTTMLKPGAIAHRDFLLPKWFALEKPGMYTIKASVKITFFQRFEPPSSVRQGLTPLETSGEFVLTIGPANEERLKKALVQLEAEIARAPALDRNESEESPGERAASRAMEAIASIKNPIALPYLVRGIWNIRGKVEWFDLPAFPGASGPGLDAELALRRFPRDIVLGQVVPMLDSTDVAERMGAAQALGALKVKEAVPSLLRFLKSDEPRVRIEGARALGRIGDSAATPALIGLLGEGDRMVRFAGGEIRDAAVRITAARALGEIGDAAAVPPLIRLLEEADRTLRETAAEALGRIRDAAAVPPLIHILQDGDRTLRETAAEALGKIGDAAAVPPLIQLLTGVDRHVRSGAVKALGEIGDATAVPPLIRLLTDADPYVRSVAATALGEIGDAAAIAPLIWRLKDPDPTVRRAAARALGEIGDTSAAPHLQALLNDPDMGVRLDARDALGKISKAAKPQ